MGVYCRHGSARWIIGIFANASGSDCWTRMGIDEWTEGVEEHRRGGQCVIYPAAKTNRCNPRGDFVPG